MSQAGGSRSMQKARTRGVLLAAAREMLASGGTPNVAEVADRAGISRATAYRYYSSPDVMMHEAVLDGIMAELDSLDLETAEGAAVAVRLETVVDRVIEMVLRNEALFRTYLRSALADGESRGARRTRWIGKAIGEDARRMGEKNARRLTAALSLLTGIETIIVLRDVCRLDEPHIKDVVRWTVKALVEASLKPDGSA